ncbi:MAG TPA: cation:proton antiporter [Candidatus Limnocylindrales bacterium]|nr:cation:proton antiporter [Candidatus Limnocylindrales bacterium]
MFAAEFLATTLALIGIIILVAALLSGLTERSGLPQVVIFLILGASIGPAGLDLLNLTLNSPELRVIATLSLVLVLFTDAITLDIHEIKTHRALAFLVLGPGTLLSAALIAFAGWELLGLTPAAATILGAALASTDPVLLRGFLHRRDLPNAVRLALKLESGLNDVVLLPIVLVAMVFINPEATLHAIYWARLGLDLFVLGPGAGVAVGLLAVAALDLIRRRIGVRRDYESLYSLGVAFTAYAAAEAVHGSGFLAAFAAGMTIIVLDVELCDCFLEYGETTAEMALLFTFVLFGSSLIWTGFTVLNGTMLLFVMIALLGRPAIFLILLARTGLDGWGRFLTSWFGPRGLSSLLIVLLPVFAGLPESERLFRICCLVVLASILLHTVSFMMLNQGSHRAKPKPTVAVKTGQPEPLPGPSPVIKEPISSVTSENRSILNPLPSNDATLFTDSVTPIISVDSNNYPRADTSGSTPSDRISLEDLRQLWRLGAPVILLDVRTERTYRDSPYQAQGAIRMPPDHAVERAIELGLPRHAWLVAYCA